MQHFFSEIKQLQPFALSSIFIFIYIMEHLFPQRKELMDARHDVANILVGLGNLVVVGAGGYFMQQLLARLSLAHFGLLYYCPLWAQIALGLLFADLFMYWRHRANHTFAFLWRFHSFHHLDKKLNASSSVRFHVIELLLSYVFKVPLFAILGISSGTVVLYGLVLIPVITLHHSNIRVGIRTDGVMRKIFVSPLMHRTHHSIIKEETNANYGSVLPLWDVLFGSYIAKATPIVDFGLPG